VKQGGGGRSINSGPVLCSLLYLFPSSSSSSPTLLSQHHNIKFKLNLPIKLQNLYTPFTVVITMDPSETVYEHEPEEEVLSHREPHLESDEVVDTVCVRVRDSLLRRAPFITGFICVH
jgi:hypothetical protein